MLTGVLQKRHISLWSRLLLSVKSGYPFRDDTVHHPGEWTTTERGAKNLRELAVQKLIFSDLDGLWAPLDADELSY